MSHSGWMALLLLLALLLANLPFLSTRFAWLGPRKAGQARWLLLELLLCYGIFLGLGWVMEAHFGQRQPQAWQFYAVSASLFICMAFPGFVWRYLLKH